MGITVLVTAAAFLIAAAPALAAPANDNFADAQVANTGDTNPTSGSNVDATKEAGEPNHAGDAGGASVWYRWTAPSSGAATVDTCDSNFDTLLGVYTGDSVSSLAVVGSSDDDCVAGMGGFVDFDAQAGQVYWIAVDGFDGETGDFDIYVVPPEPPPPPPRLALTARTTMATARWTARIPAAAGRATTTRAIRRPRRRPALTARTTMATARWMPRTPAAAGRPTTTRAIPRPRRTRRPPVTTHSPGRPETT